MEKHGWQDIPMSVKRRRVSNRSSTSSRIPPECMFCGSEEDNEDLLGKRIQRCGLTVHYFCMLLSSGLPQRGREKDGILGFMPKDIRAEVKRGRRLPCKFCKQKGATIGCNTKACRSSFHLICGRRNGTMHQFFGSFGSFCPTHRPVQASPTGDRLAFVGTANMNCSICFIMVEARPSNETLRSPCCPSSWFHRACIQRQATTAGLHFFKCPLCNNKEMFQKEMLEFGIYIPDQDAAWEMEPNAYQELLERYSKCDAQKCICPKGREYNKYASKWEISVCISCGSQGVHVKCQGLASIDEDWMCPNCDDIEKRVRSLPKKRGRPRKEGNHKSVKEELRKDYEKLYEKVTGNRPDSKTLNEDYPNCNTPGTSGLQSPSLNRSHQTPLVKKYAETVVHVTPRKDEDDAVEGVKPRKSKTEAKRRSKSSPKSFTSTHISPNQAFPIGELTVRIQPINVLPGESVSVSQHERTGILTRKQKYCPPLHKGQRPRKKFGESSQQNNQVTQEDRVNSSSGERRESFTNLPSASVSAPALSNRKRDSYRFSEWLLKNIKAPRTYGKSGCQDSVSSGVSTLATQGGSGNKASFIQQRSPGKCEDIQKRSQAESVFGREAQLAVDDVGCSPQSQKSQDVIEIPTQGGSGNKASLTFPKQILPLFNNSMEPNQDPEFIDVDCVDSYEIAQTPHSISRSNSLTGDIQLISSASDWDWDEGVLLSWSENPGVKTPTAHITHTATSTQCANPNTGQILMRTQTDQMPAHKSTFALGTSANGITEELVSPQSSITRCQQKPLVIDLTEETESLESTSNAPVTAKEICPAPFPLSSLQICEGTLQSLQSAVTSNTLQASRGTQTETVVSSAMQSGQNQRIHQLAPKSNVERRCRVKLTRSL